MRQFFQYMPIIGVILLTNIGVSCKKDNLTDCDNGSCCWPNQNNQFVKKVENVRAEYGGSAFAFQTPITGNTYQIKSALTCSTQQSMLDQMKLFNNYTFDTNGKVRLVDSSRAYSYKVSGIIYELVDSPGIAGPIYTIRIDKIDPAF